MKKHRNIVLTETPAKLSYSALITAISEKIKNSGELIACENVTELKTALNTAEK